jgi:hypothetical protein
MGIGGGKSSGSSAPVVTEEQKDLLKAQTGFLTKTAFPAYQKTLGMATDVYGQVNPAAISAANTALNVAERSGAQQEVAGGASLGLGLQGLASLFGPRYKEEQVQAAMQPAREGIREQIGSENAMFGGAGSAGSSRYALARRNTEQLGEQRLATAAAAASSGVEANRAAAAEKLAGIGLQGLTGAQQSAASRIGYAQAPQDVLGKYASIIYGTPQQSTTPSFQGTQGQTTSGKGAGFQFGGGK